MSEQLNQIHFTKKVFNDLGWRELVEVAAPPATQLPAHQVKRSLLNLIHISDTHICDAQSPARVEYLDRYADPHHRASAALGTLVGTYRAQEILTNQVLHTMIKTINKIESAPITGGAIDAVLITGDLTDNAQVNELTWFNTLATGGMLRPDSGDPTRWQGAGGDFYSPFFWNPHGTRIGELSDFPRTLYGYPEIAELLHAVRAPFKTEGFKNDWLPVHGNHDALLQGTVVPDELLRAVATSAVKIMELSDAEAITALMNVSQIGPAKYPAPLYPISTPVAPDTARDFLQPTSWTSQFSDQYQDSVAKYWRRDFAEITMIALDTVNPFGGWQGSLDLTQFRWLQSQLESLGERPVVITSHHPLEDLINDYTPNIEHRVIRKEVEELLFTHSNIVAWICGHTHRHRISFHGPDQLHGFWQIETASLIDWPQQGRVIEIFIDGSENIAIATSLFHHQAAGMIDYATADLSDVEQLATISRTLSLNDWQRRSGPFDIELNEGQANDQNIILIKHTTLN